MVDIVPAEKIEQIVGAARHETEHIGRSVSAEAVVYVLHSRECLDSLADRTSNLRECKFARAQDYGIDPGVWEDFQDVPVILTISAEWDDLEPVRTVTP